MATRYVFAALLASSAAPTEAIEVHPSSEETNAALQRGRAAAVAHTPPNRLYAWFGVAHDGQLTPHGFLTSKLGGIAVMSAHFALRSERPSDQDIQRILDEPYLMIAVFLFGHDPRFAVNSYAVLTQAERKIVPAKVRFDGAADRSTAWPKPPAYRAKVIAFFRYEDFDPRATATLSVFPPSGGEVSFDLDFAAIP